MNGNCHGKVSSMGDLWPGHVLMVIHLHSNADLFKLQTGRFGLLDTDVMLCWPDAAGMAQILS